MSARQLDPVVSLLFTGLCVMALRSEASGESSELTRIAWPRPPVTVFRYTRLSSAPSRMTPKPPVSGNRKTPVSVIELSLTWLPLAW